MAIRKEICRSSREMLNDTDIKKRKQVLEMTGQNHLRNVIGVE